MSTPSALLHPVRLRIAQVLAGEGELTTLQLHERLADVPIATLYRQVGHLLKHGLIEITDEQRVRGASERTYRLAAGFTNPSAEDLNAMSKEDLLAAFTAFTSGLIRDFGDYLQGSQPNLHADRVSFAQASFWADDDEVDAFGRALMHAIEDLLRNEPAPHRRRRTLTTVMTPREGAVEATTTSSPSEPAE